MSEFISRYGPGLPDSYKERKAVWDIERGSDRLLAAILRAYPEITPVSAGR